MLHDISFTASVSDIFDARGNRIDPALGRGVYRDDTGDLLAVCGPTFKPVQHRDIVAPIIETLEADGYEVQERTSASRRDFDDLRGQRGAFVSAKVDDGGAVMRTDIILGDFVQPTGATSYLDHGPDTNFFRISLLNSHNGKYAVRANTSYLRLICMNGMTQPHFSTSTYGRHTAGFSVQGMATKISRGISMMGEDADRFGVMARTKVTTDQAVAMLKATIAKMADKSTGEAHHSEPMVRRIMDLFKFEDQTVWGLYNAVTAWQTHHEFRANASRLTGTIGRETKVASMLKSAEWNKLCAI